MKLDRVFGLLSSCLLLFPQRFGRYVHQPFSGVCQTRKPTRNFELCPLLNPQWGSSSDSVSHNRVRVLSIPVLLLAYFKSGLILQPPNDCLLRSLGNKRL